MLAKFLLLLATVRGGRLLPFALGLFEGVPRAVVALSARLQQPSIDPDHYTSPAPKAPPECER
jgi:hypothetical protein